VTPVG
jgi:hypothetical protein